GRSPSKSVPIQPLWPPAPPEVCGNSPSLATADRLGLAHLLTARPWRGHSCVGRLDLQQSFLQRGSAFFECDHSVLMIHYESRQRAQMALNSGMPDLAVSLRRSVNKWQPNRQRRSATRLPGRWLMSSRNIRGMVGETGLEPARVTPRGPKPRASAISPLAHDPVSRKPARHLL